MYSNIKSPQSWKKSTIRRKKNALKSYRPIVERTQKFKTKKIGEPNGLKRLIRKVVKLAIILFVLGAIFVTGAFFWYAREIPKSTDLLTKNPLPSTKIYDRTGEYLLNDVNADFRRVKISLNEIPDYVKWATIVAEDREFYSHHGINLRGIVAALFSNIFRNTKIGRSSISQQFIKNALLSPEKTYTRKFKEAILTWHLENRFSKDEILEMYFNEIPYGGTAYGVEAAANKYFNKTVKELSLAEAATLAALPQAPSYYSPYGPNIDKLMARKDWVLDSLAEEGYISQEKVDVAKQEELKFAQVSSAIIAPHFVFYVRDLVAQKYGEKMLDEGGLKIITTLDINQQRIAEEAIKAGVEKNIEKYNARNAALVALNAQTGEITAMVGSADYFDEANDGAVNVAVRPRQPGSSFKPIVYAASFTKGYSPETMLFDVLTTFKAEPEDYEPHNYDETYFGPVSIRKALAGSLNVPAVKTIYLTGVDYVLDLAEKMGYSTFEDRSRFGLSLVLGGGEVKLLEHTNGFATLAREGEFKNTMAILKIEDEDGDVLEENKPKKNKGKQVLDEEKAREVTNILSDNGARAYVFGEQNYLTLGERPVAAKTGTTNDYKDAWTVGYTPQLATGIWVGNTRGETMTGAAAGANTAAPIWHEFMKRTLEETIPQEKDEPGWEVEQFTPPEPKELPQKPMLNGNFASKVQIQIDKNTGKRATALTPESQIEEKVFQEVHNILHYVNKNNPLGPAPDEPWNLDENYNNWELAVEEWARENDYETNVNLPDELDDLHTEANRPNLTINSPSNNSQFDNSDLEVNISATAPRGIRRVEYFIDNRRIAEIKSAPYDLTNFKLIGFENGEHTLKVMAYDDIDNWRAAEISIFLNLPAGINQPVTFVRPRDGEELWEEAFPYALEILLANHEYYEKVDFYIKNSATGATDWIGYKPAEAEDLVWTWSAAPTRGSYYLYTLTTDRYGTTKKSPEISIEIR